MTRNEPKEQGMVIWTAYVGESRGDRAPIAVRKLGEYPTKRECVTAVLRACGGKYAPILRLPESHSYFAVPRSR